MAKPALTSIQPPFVMAAENVSPPDAPAVEPGLERHV